MTTTIFLIVLLAALLHATWNALVKGAADKSTSMMAVVLGQGLIGLLCVICITPVPAPESWPWLMASVVLHIGYQSFLTAAYRSGDMTQVYPIARGVAPLLVTAASTLFLGITFSTMQFAAIGCVALGIASISLVRNADGVFQKQAAGLALITGSFIAGYSMIDGMGARLAGNSLSFYAWAAWLNAAIFAAAFAVRRPGVVSRALRLPVLLIGGGGASFVAYALVVHAFTQAPIALVTALRETSIVFALLMGVIWLKEPLNLVKVVATATTLAGVALLRLSKG